MTHRSKKMDNCSYSGPPRIPKISPPLAKVSCPTLYRVAPRERLFERLDECRRRPIVWISGPRIEQLHALCCKVLESWAWVIAPPRTKRGAHPLAVVGPLTSPMHCAVARSTLLSVVAGSRRRTRFAEYAYELKPLKARTSLQIRSTTCSLRASRAARAEARAFPPWKLAAIVTPTISRLFALSSVPNVYLW